MRGEVFPGMAMEGSVLISCTFFQLEIRVWWGLWFFLFGDLTCLGWDHAFTALSAGDASREGF